MSSCTEYKFLFVDNLPIFKQTALDAEFNFSEQYDSIDLIYATQDTSGVKVVLLV